MSEVHSQARTTPRTRAEIKESSASLAELAETGMRHQQHRRTWLKGQDRRGQTPDMLSIHVRPPEIEDRQFPGHWQGDLIKGAANASAVGTLVERTSRLVMLVKLPEFKPASAANLLQAFTEKLLSIAQPMRLSMTYDQGREMAMHKELSKRAGIAVYFCDPHSPWQRGSSENMNGLVRHTCPRARTCLSTAKSPWMPSQIRSTTDQGKASGYDHPWPSTGSCSSTARSTPPRFIENQGVALHF